MSSPTSLKMNHPLFIDPAIRRKHILGYLLHIWFATIPVIFLEVGYAELFKILPLWVPVILIPVDLLIAYYFWILCAILIMKIRLAVLNSIFKPREGIFPRDINNQDYKYLSLRNFTRLFPSYLIASTPFPWFRSILYFRAFNIKIGKDAINHNSWVTPEFVEIGNNVKIGFGCTIMSNFVENDKLVIKKVIIEDDVTIGVKSTIYPGVTIGENAIIGAGTYILPFKTVEPNTEYFGTPAEFIKKIDEIDYSKKHFDDLTGVNKNENE